MTTTISRRTVRSVVVAAQLFAPAVVPSITAQPASAPTSATISPDQLSRSLEPVIQLRGEPRRTFTLRERMAHYHVPGVSVALLQHGRIVWARGWGVTDSASGRNVDSATLFQGASISKPLAALSALSLVQEGRLALDTPIDSVLRSWHLPADTLTRDSAVTLRRLLMHAAGTSVSGFPGYGMATRTDNVRLPDNRDVLDGRGNTPAVRVVRIPGTVYAYSGGGYTIVEQAIEDVTGQSFEHVARARVLEPAGMAQSTFAQPLPPDRWAAAAHAHRANGAPLPGFWNDYPEQAAAGLWTTPSDLLRLGIHLAAVWRGERDDGIVTTSTLHTMFEHRGNEPGFETYGLGFGIVGADNNLSFGHNGGNAGFLSTWIIYPGHGDGIAVMTNGERGSTLAKEIVRGVAAAWDWQAHAAHVRSARRLPPEQLAAYVGTYERAGGGAAVTITAGDGVLRAASPGQSGSVLHADGDREDAFFDTEDGQDITFGRNAMGDVVTLVAYGNLVLRRGRG